MVSSAYTSATVVTAVFASDSVDAFFCEDRYQRQRARPDFAINLFKTDRLVAFVKTIDTAARLDELMPLLSK